MERARQRTREREERERGERAREERKTDEREKRKRENTACVSAVTEISSLIFSSEGSLHSSREKKKEKKNIDHF